VPPFYAHEGAAITLLAGEPVPRLIAYEGGRMLLEEIEGRDLYDAELPTLLDMVTLLVDMQLRWVDRVRDLLRLGAADWRAARLSSAIADVVERTALELSADDRATLAAFVESLPQRFAALAACGIEDTLVHGDFRPLNVRGDAQRLTVLDWGDVGVGHPLLDHTAFLERLDAANARVVQQHWIEQWQTALPGADATRALTLVRPLGPARGAVVYRHFLDHIEPSEHVYHRNDPAACLRQTATLVRQSDTD
jgi:aminoglycoside phosphotransferase (APT) family kinase protein